MIMVTMQEMTEAGLPFFILFYKPGDDDILTRYRNFIAKELMSARGSVTQRCKVYIAGC